MLQHGIHGMEEIENPSEYGIDWEGPIPPVESNTAVIVNEPSNILNNEQYNNLTSRVNPLQLDNYYGINIYLNCVHTISDILLNN